MNKFLFIFLNVLIFKQSIFYCADLKLSVENNKVKDEAIIPFDQNMLIYNIFECSDNAEAIIKLLDNAKKSGMNIKDIIHIIKRHLEALKRRKTSADSTLVLNKTLMDENFAIKLHEEEMNSIFAEEKKFNKALKIAYFLYAKEKHCEVLKKTMQLDKDKGNILQIIDGYNFDCNNYDELQNIYHYGLNLELLEKKFDAEKKAKEAAFKKSENDKSKLPLSDAILAKEKFNAPEIHAANLKELGRSTRQINEELYAIGMRQISNVPLSSLASLLYSLS